MEAPELLQPIIIISKEFKFFFLVYIYRSLIWAPKLHAPKINNVMSKSSRIVPERLYTFLNSSISYNLQFGFRQHYTKPHALININENIRKALDDENIGCGVCVDLQKAFETVDYQILLAKLNHYRICEVSNDWFKSYVSNRYQFVSING